jgi:superfamily II DNA or RNA helicase
VLREYQSDIVSLARRSYMKGFKSPLIVLPCGSGKTMIAAGIAMGAARKGNRALILEHRRELRDQTERVLEECGVDMGMCKVAMVQAACRRLEECGNPALIIVDEAHHSISSSYRRIFEAFPDARRLGLTATPQRLDGKGLGAVFDDIVEGVTAKWLIENGYLAPFRLFSLPLADFSCLKVERGEYAMGDLMEKKAIYGNTVDSYRRIADGRKAIAYCPSVESARMTAAEFSLGGYAAAFLSGETPGAERREKMEMFRRGDIQILANCELFGDGVDIPDCSCAILLRKTKSLTLYIQQSMRAMRFQPGKVAIIIDHVLNCAEHGLPDAGHPWSLDGSKLNRTCGGPDVKACPECFAVVERSAEICPLCGHAFERGGPRMAAGAEMVDAELADVTDGLRKAERLRAMRYADYKSIGDFAGLDAFRKARGYKFLWTIRKALELGIGIPAKYSWLRRKALSGR